MKNSMRPKDVRANVEELPSVEEGLEGLLDETVQLEDGETNFKHYGHDFVVLNVRGKNATTTLRMVNRNLPPHLVAHPLICVRSARGDTVYGVRDPHFEPDVQTKLHPSDLNEEEQIMLAIKIAIAKDAIESYRTDRKLRELDLHVYANSSKTRWQVTELLR